MRGGGTNRSWVVSAEKEPPWERILERRTANLLASYELTLERLIDAVRHGRKESYENLKKRLENAHKELMAHIEALGRRL